MPTGVGIPGHTRKGLCTKEETGVEQPPPPGSNPLPLGSTTLEEVTSTKRSVTQKSCRAGGRVKREREPEREALMLPRASDSAKLARGVGACH